MKLIVLGLIVIVSSSLLFFFYPVLKAGFDLLMLDNNNFKIQLEYIEKKPRQLTPVDTQFGIVINKIAANGKIIDFDVIGEADYLEDKLFEGLVHPSDSAYPGNQGNVVIIAQTPGDWYKYTRSNPQFYLIDRLKTGDLIELYYVGEKFDYSVTTNLYVPENSVNKYTKQSDQKQLTILSGWPAGTMLFRQVIQAKMVEKVY